VTRAATSPAVDNAGAVPAAGEVSPVSPGEIVARGMADGGRRIKRYTVDFESGEVAITYYPAECETERADLKARVLKALKDSRCPLTRKQLARVIGLKGVSGRFSPTVATLVATEEIYERDGELTDSANKFGDDTYT
jgi:hypothetical protein